MDSALLIALLQDGEDPNVHPAMQTDDFLSIVKTLPIDATQSLLLSTHRRK